MKVIDVHCHIVPSDFPAGPSSCAAHWPRMDHRPDQQAMVMVGSREFRLVDHRCWDTQRRVADMNSEEVGMQVLSPMPELLSYWIEAGPGLDLARHVNGAIAKMIEAAPDRFHGLGMVPLQDPDLAAKELGVLRSKYGLSGVEIGSNINGKPPGDPSFDGFFAEAERLELAVFVHALHPAATDRLVGPAKRIEALVSFPLDVGLAAASVISGRTLEKFPNLRIAFSHGGGTLASFLPRWQSGWGRSADLKSAMASPTEVARRFYYDNIVFDAGLLGHVVRTFGTTQVLVGTDYPFAGGQEKSAQMFDKLGLAADDLALLRGKNAERFLALG